MNANNAGFSFLGQQYLGKIKIDNKIRVVQVTAEDILPGKSNDGQQRFSVITADGRRFFGTILDGFFVQDGLRAHLIPTTSSEFLGKEIMGKLIINEEVVIVPLSVERKEGEHGFPRFAVLTNEGRRHFGTIVNSFFLEEGVVKFEASKAAKLKERTEPFRAGVTVTIDTSFFEPLKARIKKLKAKCLEMKVSEEDKKADEKVTKTGGMILETKEGDIVTVRFDGKGLRLLAEGYLDMGEHLIDAALSLYRMGFFKAFKNAGDATELRVKERDEELKKLNALK